MEYSYVCDDCHIGVNCNTENEALAGLKTHNDHRAIAKRRNIPFAYSLKLQAEDWK